MKIMTRIIQLSVLLVATFSMSAAMACTVGAWNGGVTGDPAPLDGDPPTALPRVSGNCAMTLTAAGSVKDVSPLAETKVFIRFYVLAELNSGAPTIFQAFSTDAAENADTLLYVTLHDGGTNFNFNAGVQDSGPVAGKSGWNMIELAWTGDATMDYWVNTDSSEAPTGSVPAAAGTMESVILGSVEAIDGKLIFDDYESHRTSPVGGLLAGDANSDGGINSGDIDMVVAEFLFSTLADGVVDCNLDGSVNSGDIDCIVKIFLGL